MKNRYFVFLTLGALMLGAIAGCREDNDRTEPKPQPEPNEQIAVNLRANIEPSRINVKFRWSKHKG